MTHQSRLLVADAAFVSPEIIERNRLVTVFPRNRADGAFRSTYDDLLQRSKLQSAYYEKTLPRLHESLARFLPDAGNELAQFVRPVLVTLTSLFVDRCLRVLHRVGQSVNEDLGVVSVIPPADIAWLDEIRHPGSVSWHLNQAIIERIAAALGLPGSPIWNSDEYPEYPPRPAQRNLLFAPPREGLGSIGHKLLNRILAAIRRMPNRSASYVSAGLGGDDYYLTLRGFYGPFGLFDRLEGITLQPGTRDEVLRARVLADVGPYLSSAMRGLLTAVGAAGCSGGRLDALGNAYAEMYVDYYPSGFLEGLPANLEFAEKCLAKHKAHVLIGSSLNSDAGYFLAAVVRARGGKVLGAQHGGHYGYIEDMSLAGQFEYQSYDYMITWGWEEIDPHLPQCKTIPLPAPRLSGKPIDGNRLARHMNGKNVASDILFLSNLLQRFPHISTCGQARIDFIDEIRDSQRALVEALARAGFSTDHKPYNQSNVDFLKDHYDDLARLGGRQYRRLESRQKGLSPQLLKGYRIILWDQMGTGILDCFTGSIPTMVYWQRIYSREFSAAAGLVRSLGEVGVIHPSPDSLVRELKLFLNDPHAWMINADRVEAIRNFCRKFARTANNWASIWKHELGSRFQK